MYVDGADEADPQLHLIKGGGAALTREKIIAAVARRFVCIVDDSKLVPVLGRFPLPIEVIPMARSYVARELVRLGGHPVYREGVVTDNGNQILDVHGLKIADPVGLEERINQIVGVVTVGLFARRPADVLIVARDSGVETLKTESRLTTLLSHQPRPPIDQTRVDLHEVSARIERIPGVARRVDSACRDDRHARTERCPQQLHRLQGKRPQRRAAQSTRLRAPALSRSHCGSTSCWSR